MKCLVNFKAIYDVTIEVDGVPHEAAAITLVKAGGGNIVEQSYERVHPETEFFIEIDDRHPAEIEADYEPDYDGFDSRGDR